MNFKYVMMACALTLGFASCSNDDAVDNSGIIPNGEPTVARIKLSQVAGPKTRGIEEAVDGEAIVKNATVFIFDAGAKLEATVTLSNTEASTGKVVEITTGSHYFYAAVNAIADVPTSFPVGTPLATVKQTVLGCATLGDLTKDDGFFMTNVSDALAKNIVESDKPDGSDNPVEIKVGRAVAKVNVALTADVKNGKEVAGGKFTNMSYKMGGNPNKMYLFPVYESGVFKTPFYSDIYAAANYYGDAAYRADGTPGYVIENANAKVIKQGEATHALVKGTFTPDGKTEGVDFWRIYNASTKLWEDGIYYNIGDAKTAANYPTDQETMKIVEYAGGVCYYAFWVADKNAADLYAVSRNNYYDIKIETVSKIGTNQEDGDKDIDNEYIEPSNPPVEPGDPIEEEKNTVKVSINVLDWTVVETGVGL
ncbi:Mfa1 family fimbria major subunit [Bacteroides sp. 51]|uniref:Mfa1 family fimbria major subunit n=1 Tax=Bacteroides sp. 51 TaxID=2302938 RepID=UPI0013D7A79B|nr:Mfa1 family fimbria major subunit [Bacteroides sp. 51]